MPNKVIGYGVIRGITQIDSVEVIHVLNCDLRNECAASGCSIGATTHPDQVNTSVVASIISTIAV